MLLGNSLSVSSGEVSARAGMLLNSWRWVTRRASCAADCARSACRFLLHELSLGTELLNKLLNFPFPFWARLSRRLRQITTWLLSSAGDVQHLAGSGPSATQLWCGEHACFRLTWEFVPIAHGLDREKPSIHIYCQWDVTKKNQTNEALYNKTRSRLLL